MRFALGQPWRPARVLCACRRLDGPRHRGLRSFRRFLTTLPTTSPLSAKIAFEDMRSASGIDFPMSFDTRRALGIKETIGHPAALLDADGDGLLDVLLAAHNRVALFRNVGGWRFQTVAATGFHQDGYWQGVAVGDVDNDGRPDLFLSGFGCSSLYLNEGGCRFRDATATSGLAPVPATRWQTSATFADVDRDGQLDLYVTCYVELGKKTGVCTYPGGVSTACTPTDFCARNGHLLSQLEHARRSPTRPRHLDSMSHTAMGSVSRLAIRMTIPTPTSIWPTTCFPAISTSTSTAEGSSTRALNPAPPSNSMARVRRAWAPTSATTIRTAEKTWL